MLLSGARRVGLTGTNSWPDLAYVAGFVLAYFGLDRITTALAALDPADVDRASLLVGAILGNRPVAVLVVIVALALIWRSPSRLACRWWELGHGNAIRWIAAGPVILLAWQSGFYHYNYLLGRAHLFDRALVLALAVGVIARPALLVPFVIQSRVIAAQFGLPFGTLAAQNIDELLLVALLVIAGAHVVFVVTGKRDSSPLLLLLAAAIATHFFIPGRGKLLLNWVIHDDLSNLPASGYAVGWLGQTDGGVALWLAGLLGALNWPLRIATLVVELGAALAAAHHRLLRVWLPVVALFHVVNFVLLGFWFLGWIALELVLFVLLTRRDLVEWFDRNLSVARAAVALVLVGVLGPVLFHPPGLAWYDTPLAYGYEIEVVGQSGATYNLEHEAFAPFSQELAFSRLQLGETRPLTGAYGVVVTVAELERLRALTDVADAAPLEDRTDESDAARQVGAERFLADFVGHADDRAAGGNRLADVLDVVAPFPKYWTGRPDPVYRFDDPIVRLEVFRTTNLHVDDGFQRRRTSVLVMNTP